MGLLTESSVAIDGSKFKAVNNRDKNFSRARWTGAWRRLPKADIGLAPGYTIARDRDAELGFMNEPPGFDIDGRFGQVI
jgi:hypothetical protein